MFLFHGSSASALETTSVSLGRVYTYELVWRHFTTRKPRELDHDCLFASSACS